MKLRALDLSMGWAGPLVTQMLAETPGVEVIKVEDTHNFDWWRGSLSMAPPEMQPAERSPTFNTANRGKRGVTLDLSHPRGVEILKQLIKLSDLLVENFSPGVMQRLGLDWTVVSALNPRMIMMSMPAFGSDGPEANCRGYGMTMEAMAGVTGLCAYHDCERPYMLENALGDPVTGLNGTFAILSALWERRRTNRGQHIEIAQVEGVIPLIGPQLVEYQVTGEPPRRHGNRHPQYAPHGIYRCSGEDNWIALAIRTDEEWQRLIELPEFKYLAADRRFESAASRHANHDALDAELKTVLIMANAEDMMSRLISADLIVGTVNSAPQVLADRQIAARGFFIPVERAVVGTHLYPAAIAHLSATPLDPSRPAPLMGEHNAKVICELVGISAAEFHDLEAAGIIGTKPRAYSVKAQSAA
jgi:crotonobetainyl-CoA:carnitine CoA-transferase CaiB-like acyl-CoA transferase